MPSLSLQKYQQTALRFLFEIAVRQRWPRAAGRVAAWSCTKPQQGKLVALLANPNKDGIVADAQQSLKPHFEIIQWPSFILKIPADRILSKKCKDANTYKTQDVEIEKSKGNLRDFWSIAWRQFLKHIPVDVVITSNFGFRSDREFATSLEAAGTPFIVIQKENLNGITKPRWDFWRAAYLGRGEFTGRAILTYNNIERELQIDSGVAKPDQVKVTGMPRLDRIHGWRRDNVGDLSANHVVFFSFDRRDKIPPGLAGELNWGKFCEHTHRAVYEFAADNSQVNVTVKSKGQKSHLNDVLAMLQSFGPPPPNLKIVRGGDPMELITKATVVVGFNTTAILEALAAGKPVIVPRYAEALSEELQPFILNIGDAPTYANSVSDLRVKIQQFLNRPVPIPSELSEQVTAILRQWVGNDDGLAGKRVLAAVTAEVARNDRNLGPLSHGSG